MGKKPTLRVKRGVGERIFRTDLYIVWHCLRGDGIYLYVFFSVCVPDYGGQRTYLYGDRHTVYDAYGVAVRICPAGMLQGNCLVMEENHRKEAGMKKQT